jgi:DNA-binding winged helix-turn-helix (wHTH) protein/tetratricopeptide (TPR) repeat protein
LRDPKGFVVNATQQLLRFGIFELNATTGELRRSGKVVKLPPLSCRLLALLASRAGQPVPREEIQKQLWDTKADVDFEHGVNKCIQQIRNALGDDAESPLYIETLPRFGYRFLAPVVSKVVAIPRPNVVSSNSGELSRGSALRVGSSGPAASVAQAATIPFPVTPSESEAEVPQKTSGNIRHSRPLWSVAALLLIATFAGLLYWRNGRTTALTEKDTLVIAEFDNRTGDPVFDETLRQGLSSQLEQSPFLNLLSDGRIAQTLSLMAQPKDTRLSAQLAQEVCQRTASAATIEGSISMLGSQYVLGLKAVDCRGGNVLDDEQSTASSKEQVLKALGNSATKLRRRLGESLASVEKYDAPAEEVTTPSLEALHAYSVGYQAMFRRSDYTAAIRSFQEATSLDPKFAMAYARLGMNYDNLGESSRAVDSLRRAYELRDRVSERERFYIDSHYEQLVLGDLEAARKTCELWAQTYAYDGIPWDNLSYIHTGLGDYESALFAAQNSVQVAPGTALTYGNLVIRYINLNRLDEAMATVQEAESHQLDAPLVRFNLYFLHFLRRDQAEMQKEFTAMMAKPGQESQMLFLASDTAAYFGQFANGRELSHRASATAQHTGNKEVAASYIAESALREALAGNGALARHQAEAALAISNGRDIISISAIAIALAGDPAQASRLAEDLAKRFSQDTVVQVNYLPSIYAAIALANGSASQAIEVLSPVTPYEKGGAAPYSAGIPNLSFYSVYIRGQAFLAGHQGSAAAAEFQKIIAHPGIVLNQPIGALAHLQLGRALVMQGEAAKAKAAYQDFFNLWQNADSDIPVLNQAKAEYLRLPRIAPA